jgi:hypothetical protein
VQVSVSASVGVDTAAKPADATAAASTRRALRVVIIVYLEETVELPEIATGSARIAPFL